MTTPRRSIDELVATIRNKEPMKEYQTDKYHEARAALKEAEGDGE